MPGLFEFSTLTDAVNVIKRKQGLLFQELVFRDRNTNATSKIQFDRSSSRRQLLPIVSKVEGGSIIVRSGFEAREIEAPRLRPKMQFPAADLLRTRAPGQSPYIPRGDGSPQAAVEKTLSTELANIRDRIDLTIEYWCGQFLQTGACTVENDGVLFNVDYLMPATNKITLATGHKWNEAGGLPLDDMATWSQLTVNQTGLSIDTMILGSSAASAFRANAQVKSELDTRRIESGQLSPTVASAYLGTINGVALYQYGGTYNDASGNPVSFLPADKVLAFSSLADVSLEFGLILDMEDDTGIPQPIQAEYFSKSWTDKDPPVRWLLVESDPLPVLRLPEAFVCADVL